MTFEEWWKQYDTHLPNDTGEMACAYAAWQAALEEAAKIADAYHEEIPVTFSGSNGEHKTTIGFDGMRIGYTIRQLKEKP